ncbi:MAG: hypothetical protein ABH871_04335 [Pseudomonadota bacterium]
MALLITVIALALLMVVASVGPYFIPTSTYQNIIEEALTQRLNARVVIDDFRLRLIPYPGYTITGFKLVSKDPPFQGMHVLSAKKINGSLALSALLEGDFDTSIEARDVNINYSSRSGVSNMGMMLGIKAGAPVVPTSPAAPESKEPTKESPIPSEQAPPLKEIPAMPAPSIDIPADKGEVSFNRLMKHVFLSSAQASVSDDEGAKLTLRNIQVVRGRIDISTEESTQPLIIEGVSIAAKDLKMATGFGAQLSMTGAVGGALRPNLKIEGQIFVDTMGGEISGRDVRAYINGAQLVADISANYSMSPPSYDVHIATLDLNPDAFAPMLSFIGRTLPFKLSWQGSVGADVSFKGTRDTGELALQLDATQARMFADNSAIKEPGILLKAQADVLVKPDSFAFDRASLTLAGSDMNIAGEIKRDEDFETRLSVSGDGLTLAAIQTLLPWLSNMGSMENGSVDLTLEGPLAKSEELEVQGRLEASKAGIADISLSEVSTSFVREDGKISFVTLKGKFADADLSGNGQIQLGALPAMNFDVVVGDVETQNIQTIGNAISAKASLVVKAQSEGTDRESLQKNLLLSGSIVSSNAKISESKGAAGAFSKNTWDEIESKSGAILRETTEKELENVGDEVSDFKASFEITDEKIEISEASWKAKEYSALLTTTVLSSGELTASGTLAVEKDISEKLVADAQARKMLLNTKGMLIIPVSGSGKLGEPKLEIDSVKLTALIEDRLKPKPATEIVEEEKIMEVEKKMEAEEKVEAEEKIEEKKPAQIKEEKRTPSKAQPARKAPDQPVEDVLKVIIGQ